MAQITLGTINPRPKPVAPKVHKYHLAMTPETQSRMLDLKDELSKKAGATVSLNVLFKLLVDQAWKELQQEDIS